MPVKLSSMPDPPKEYVVDLPKLNGGLNLWDLDYRMDANQSPNMKNLYWLDGALTCRPGQNWITDDTDRGVGYSCYGELYWDHIFLHIGSHIYYADGSSVDDAFESAPLTVTELLDADGKSITVPENRGTWFRYGDNLYYKNRGGYFRIKYNEDGTFEIGGVEPYAPITYINMEPTTHAGDEYQPENRICPTQTMWYSVVEEVVEYKLPITGLDSVDKVIVDEVELTEVESADLPEYVPLEGVSTDSAVDDKVDEDGMKIVAVYAGNSVTFTAVASGTGLTYQWQWRASADGTWANCTTEGCTETLMTIQEVNSGYNGYQYRCAITDDDEVTYTSGYQIYIRPVATCYAVDLEKGLVTFDAPPKFHNPYSANTVKITLTKSNEDAYNSIMDCPYAAVYGGDQNLCVVLGGCPAQPNAYFWCGNHTVMDPGYFPFEQYNFAGDTEEHITGFGKQQSMLVIFKERSLGRASFSTTEMASGRVLITMDYTAINSRIGCDLPWTIQLVENNLVFCNTENGAYLLKDSTSAYENNVVSISRNVNGAVRKSGLLDAVRTAEVTASHNDGDRYWVVAGGEAYVWDYTLSTYSEPSWFYFTNIHAVDFIRRNEEIYHLNGAGRLTAMRHTYLDYDEGIEKVYQFAAQSLGSYDRLKDVLSVVFVVRSDTNSLAEITYITDYEERADLTPIHAFSWRFLPRNLSHRYLGLAKFATVARRKPFARHVRHFSMRLENRDPATDMSVVSAQIFYRYQGRER